MLEMGIKICIIKRKDLGGKKESEREHHIGEDEKDVEGKGHYKEGWRWPRVGERGRERGSKGRDGYQLLGKAGSRERGRREGMTVVQG